MIDILGHSLNTWIANFLELLSNDNICVFHSFKWFSILQKVGLHALTPQMEDLSFEDRWAGGSVQVEVLMVSSEKV